MKKLLLATATVAFLAACGSKSGGKQVLVDKCVEDGDADKETCVCMVDAMEDGLNKDTFKKLVKAAEDGGDPEAVMEDLMGDMSDPDQMAELMAVGMGVMKCDPSIMEGFQ